MSVGPSIAITVIILFVVFIGWGRSSYGQTILTRIFGPPAGSKRTPRKPANAVKSGKPMSSTTKSRVRKPVPKSVSKDDLTTMTPTLPPKVTRSATRRPSTK